MVSSIEGEPRTWVGLVYRLVTQSDASEILKGVLAFASMTLFILLPVIMMGGGIALYKYISAKPETLWTSSRNCLDLKEIHGQVYKIDQCAKTVELISPTSNQVSKNAKAVIR